MESELCRLLSLPNNNNYNHNNNNNNNNNTHNIFKTI